MARWSLRTRMVAVVAAAFLPVLCLATLAAYLDAKAREARRTEAAIASAEIASSAHRQLLEGSRRLLISACSEESVKKSTESAAAPGDVGRCEAYLGALMHRFPAEYSSVVVTDSAGEVRCASSPAALDRNLGDREIFKNVRDTKSFAIGAAIASRVTRNTIVPLAMPIAAGGRFLGMCAIGISIKAFGDLSLNALDSSVLVDRSGAPFGGRPENMLALPSANRIAQAIADNRLVFSEYGQNGRAYEFHVLPVAGDVLFTVAAVPALTGMATLQDWSLVGLTLLAMAIALVAVWLGSDYWIARPLRQVGEFAGRSARGETAKLVPLPAWPLEVAEAGKGISEMAAAIAGHGDELRAGLEQRDHMLREIHHRVKNNLQMISSLLNLQAGEIRSPRLRRFFGDAQNRVLTLSILHKHLYERSSWSLVDFQQFISDLVRQITVAKSGTTDRAAPRYQIRAPTMAVGPDTAIPVGLIVTESVSSALNHDFSGVAQPEIRIEAVQKDDENAELIIEDNGAQTAHGSIAPGLRGGFGVTLVRGLAMQLGGEATITAKEEGGVRIVVAFPLSRDMEDDKVGENG